MSRLRAALATVSGLVAVTSTGAAIAATADQAPADAAIASFTERVTGAGWVSVGPYEFSDQDSEDDQMFAKCQLDYVALSGMDAASFDGETARAVSEAFTFSTPGDATASTELFEMELDDEEQLAAFVITVDDEHAGDIAAMVELIGSSGFADCLSQALEEQMASGEDSEVPTVEFEVAVDNEADLGVGDASVRLDFTLSAELFGEAFAVDASYLFAHVDRSLVGVVSLFSGSGEPASGLDPLAELEHIVSDLGG